MTYYDDYIRERADELFDQEKTKFAFYDQDYNEIDVLDNNLNEQVFIGAMREMVAYLYERKREIEDAGSLELLFDPDNVEKIYITARGLEAPTVIVEYKKTPEWFSMKNAALREFYWHPKPALSGEWTAGYFQPR